MRRTEVLAASAINVPALDHHVLLAISVLAISVLAISVLALAPGAESRAS